MSKDSKKLFVSAEEAAEFFGVKVNIINEAFEKGLPIKHKGDDWYIDEVA